MDEKQLIQAAGNGETAAATELVNRHYQPIYGFLRRLSGNDADAADLTQKTFSRLWSSLPNYAERSSFSSWLHGIAYHVFQDFARTNHRIEPRSEEWWLRQPDQHIGPDCQTMNNDLRSTVHRQVNELEADLRLVIHLHYYQGLTLEETAFALEVAPSTVKYRLRMGLQQLQSSLTEKPISSPRYS
jgi:RNA polymerase sigma-70 factor, ECF subfamily